MHEEASLIDSDLKSAWIVETTITILPDPLIQLLQVVLGLEQSTVR